MEEQSHGLDANVRECWRRAQRCRVAAAALQLDDPAADELIAEALEWEAEADRRLAARLPKWRVSYIIEDSHRIISQGQLEVPASDRFTAAQVAVATIIEDDPLVSDRRSVKAVSVEEVRI